MKFTSRVNLTQLKNLCSRAWARKLGSVKYWQGESSMAETYNWKVLNTLFLSFVSLLLFHYKRHEQNKADIAVNKADSSRQ